MSTEYTPPIMLDGLIEIDTTPDPDGDLEVCSADGDHIAYLRQEDQIALRDLLNRLHPEPEPKPLHSLCIGSPEALCGDVGGVHVTGRGDVTCPACRTLMLAQVATDLERRGESLITTKNTGSIYAERAQGRGNGYIEAARLIRHAIKDALPKDPEYTHCAAGGCTKQWEVSSEDPDATMGDMLTHAIQVHGEISPTRILKEGPRP